MAKDYLSEDSTDFEPTKPAVTRVAIVDVHVSAKPTLTHARVHLADADIEFTGEAEAGTGEAEAVALATIAATAKLLGVDVFLREAALVPLGGHLIAVCVLEVLTRARPLLLTGGALVRHDETTAQTMARAVLDALNRQLTA